MARCVPVPLESTGTAFFAATVHFRPEVSPVVTVKSDEVTATSARAYVLTASVRLVGCAEQRIIRVALFLMMLRAPSITSLWLHLAMRYSLR